MKIEQYPKTFVQILFHPKEFFDGIRKQSVRESFWFCAPVLVPLLLANLVLGWKIMGETLAGFSVSSLSSLFLVLLVLQAFGPIVLVPLFIHYLSRFFGSKVNDYSAFKVLWYAYISIGLLIFVSSSLVYFFAMQVYAVILKTLIVNVVFGLWNLYISLVGVSVLYKISKLRSFFLYFVSFLVFNFVVSFASSLVAMGAVL